MILKKLLTTTALVAMTATGAYVASPAPYAAAATMASGYIQKADADDHFASDLIGATVYNAATEDGEAIGDVNDLVVSADGGIDAVVIGVGGFLGIGEKNVAVSYDSLTWKTDANGDAWPVLAATQEQLESAPNFERSEQMAMATDGAAVKKPVAGEQMAEPTDQPSDDAMGVDKRDQVASSPANDRRKAYDPSLVSAENLIDTTVYSADGENVGEVSDVLLNDSGEIDAVVIDVGGFLGIGEKPVAIEFTDLRIAVDQNEDLILQTAFTRDQLDSAPEYDETAYRENRDQVVARSKS